MHALNSFSSLPIAAQRLIFSFFSTEDLKILRQACKEFKRLAEQSVICHPLKEKDVSFLFSSIGAEQPKDRLCLQEKTKALDSYLKNLLPFNFFPLSGSLEEYNAMQVKKRKEYLDKRFAHFFKKGGEAEIADLPLQERRRGGNYRFIPLRPLRLREN